MKKLITLLLATCMCLTLGFTLAACDSTNEGQSHTHDYGKTICFDGQNHWIECSCGDKKDVEAHKGGTATCIKKAECSVCEEEYGDLEDHNYATAWSVNDQKHWKACMTENCQATKEEGLHDYTNGACVCGKEPLVQDGSAVTKTQWEEAFAFENVTINQYEIVENEKVLQTKMLLDGNVAAVKMEENVFVMPEGYADIIRMPLDLSLYFEQAQYQDGIYTISNIDMFGDESYVYNSASLTFEDGVLKYLSAIVTEEVVDEDEISGVRKETSEYYFEFEDYGTTEVELPSLPITQGEWEEAFAIENLDNATITTTISGVYQQYFFANDKQRITATTMYVTLDMYCVNSIWYNYDQSTNTHSVLSPTDPIYPGTTMKQAMVDMFSIMVETYSYMTYDEETDMYIFTVEGAGGYYVKITDGKVSQIMVMNAVEGGMDIQTYTFSNYGTTTITVPFVIA